MEKTSDPIEAISKDQDRNFYMTFKYKIKVFILELDPRKSTISCCGYHHSQDPHHDRPAAAHLVFSALLGLR